MLQSITAEIIATKSQIKEKAFRLQERQWQMEGRIEGIGRSAVRPGSDLAKSSQSVGVLKAAVQILEEASEKLEKLLVKSE